MSYKNKLSNYQGDCGVEIGMYANFSDYIKIFSQQLKISHDDTQKIGIDIGAGPGGCNGKFFENCILDGCDADPNVVETLPSDRYRNKFVYLLGQHEKLPYSNATIDFAVCSCVIQHLNSFEELKSGIQEVSRILKQGGELFLMFKAGTNDSLLTHLNGYYKETRTFRVFEPKMVEAVCAEYGLHAVSTEKFVDSNWIPYCCMTLIRYF
jgi:ubiquinone/menaquinone biosynthesis C-methylase UbiE